ncbi:GNAT family N-acetyltransferase [Brevundimonas abyssalis]|uniref:GNAT family N-acetyltransferase n=1 Tax=Brevundimonas abyssalis TaxID=1125965 RepID=UPI000428371E
MTAFAIRPATPDDAPALAVLGRATFIETFVTGFEIPYPPEDLEPFLDETFSEATTRARLSDPDHHYWVAEQDGEVLASPTPAAAACRILTRGRAMRNCTGFMCRRRRRGWVSARPC